MASSKHKGRYGQGSVSRQEDANGNPLPGKSANWLLRWRDKDGVQKSESSGTTDKAEAIRLLNVKLGALANDEPIPETGRNAHRFEDGETAIVEDYRNNNQDVPTLKRRLRHLKQVFARRVLVEITTPEIKAYTSARFKAGASRSTVRNELSALKRMFSIGMEDGVINRRPHFPMPDTRGNERRGFFERDQFEAVRAKLPEWLRGVMTFAFYTGWRLPSEILTLEWRQVDRAAKVIRLYDSKNKEGRVVPYGLVPEFVEVIDAQERERARLAAAGAICPYVFHENGSRLFQTSHPKDEPEAEYLYAIHGVRNAWNTACTAAGVPGRIPHDFRRTAVRNLVRAGVPEKIAMQITGHKTRAVFDRYDIVDEADLANAMSQLARTTDGTATNAGPRVVRLKPRARRAAGKGAR